MPVSARSVSQAEFSSDNWRPPADRTGGLAVNKLFHIGVSHVRLYVKLRLILLHQILVSTGSHAMHSSRTAGRGSNVIYQLRVGWWMSHTCATSSPSGSPHLPVLLAHRPRKSSCRISISMQRSTYSRTVLNSVAPSLIREACSGGMSIEIRFSRRLPSNGFLDGSAASSRFACTAHFSIACTT